SNSISFVFNDDAEEWGNNNKTVEEGTRSPPPLLPTAWSTTQQQTIVPQKQAVYASLWENVDMYADPNLINRTAATIVGVGAKGESRPFDWIQEITLQFICETRGSGESSEEPLADPLSYVDILEALSQ
ncbi:hypothetical protein FOZ62_012721, partial [Perkinsus olseni]